VTKKDLEIILKASLNELIRKDSYLIEHDVHEQAISSKLGCYLSERIPKKENGGWDVDVEYNRNGETPKSLHECGIVLPDIIIHRRGLNNDNNTEDNNLLIIEIKKNATISEKNSDIRKIEAFINEPPFSYCFGTFINIKSFVRDKFITFWFHRRERSE
jgi:hypothetical protein